MHHTGLTPVALARPPLPADRHPVAGHLASHTPGSRHTLLG
jgi:hypothetical protein